MSPYTNRKHTHTHTHTSVLLRSAVDLASVTVFLDPRRHWTHTHTHTAVSC